MVMLQNVCENCVEASSAPYVRYLVIKVKETYILIDKPKREKPKTEIGCEVPSTSILRRSQQLNISETYFT